MGRWGQSLGVWLSMGPYRQGTHMAPLGPWALSLGCMAQPQAGILYRYPRTSHLDMVLLRGLLKRGYSGPTPKGLS